MSLYTWLGGVTENNLHFNTERDLSNPCPVNWQLHPPMALFTTYIDKEKVKAYVLEVIDEQQAEHIGEIVEAVIQRLQQGEEPNIEELIPTDEENGEG